MSAREDPSSRSWKLDAPLDLEGTTHVRDHGRSNPTVQRLGPGELLQAVRTPDGPATVHIRVSAGQVDAQAWGPGREWVLEAVQGYLGLDAPPLRFGGQLASIEARHPGVRRSRALNGFDVLVNHVIRQRVAWRDAVQTQLALLRAHAEPAPGPGELRLPLAPEQFHALGAADLAVFGLERKRASALLQVATRAERIRSWFGLPREELALRLQALPGIGPWTCTMVQAIGLGEDDVVPLGDYALPSMVTWVLSGEPRGNDARMLELLEPWAGRRFRVIHLLWAAGKTAPRFGPGIRGVGPGIAGPGNRSRFG